MKKYAWLFIIVGAFMFAFVVARQTLFEYIIAVFSIVFLCKGIVLGVDNLFEDESE